MTEGTAGANPTGAKFSVRTRLVIIVAASVALWTPVVAAACMSI